MSTVSDLLARTPTEIRRAGGSVPWRLGLLGLALLEYSPRWGPLIEGSGATSLP
ncbi:hypothetical protein JOD52_002069 [Brachybacterium muris]|uniref:hypothetical protein n=1 Tax=Brachybacterium muris TaxID=219301 RepID=UPI00195C8962|nr:hypothetical protein [Brachybacterium muris]MBM7501229.1 hypothetical protein [Brachybacterium muris]